MEILGSKFLKICFQDIMELTYLGLSGINWHLHYQIIHTISYAI